MNFGSVSHELSMQVRKLYQPEKLPTEVRVIEVEVLGRENGSFYACLQFQRYIFVVHKPQDLKKWYINTYQCLEC